jgi:hypothetical protein
MHIRFLALLILWTATPAFAQLDVTLIGTQIPRFREVTASIYAGANPSSSSAGEGLNSIAAGGIHTIISLQGGDLDGTFQGWVAGLRQPGEFPDAVMNEKLLWEARGLEWFNFPLNSRIPKTEAEDKGIREALEIMNAATPERKVYLHCEHGADRTGLLIALYRVKYLGWDPLDAHAEWVRNGHGRVSRIFTGNLDVYFWSFVRELGKSPAGDCQKKVLSRRAV